MRPFGRKKQPYGRNQDPDNNPQSGNEPDKPADDPLVRAFVRDYTPAMNQEDPGTINMSLNDLRHTFNAFQSPTGFDPLKKILNQLDQNGFQIQIRNHKDEFVLPVRRATLLRETGVKTLPMPENN